ITSLNGVFISHNHMDHAQGIEELLTQIPVNHIYTSTKYNNEAILKQNKTPVTQLSEGSVLESEDGLEIVIYWPDKKTKALERDEQNEASMILRLSYGERSFLFTGDIGFETEEEILKKIPKCDVLKIGHHGSKYATSDEFLKKVHPALAVISVGRYNSFGHPTDEVLNRIEAIGAQCRRTDKNGAVEVTTDGTNLKVKQYIQ
ncbi:MAG: MBL fold metallo-hydrolase, partial [Eubacterium sp.]